MAGDAATATSAGQHTAGYQAAALLPGEALHLQLCLMFALHTLCIGKQPAGGRLCMCVLLQQATHIFNRRRRTVPALLQVLRSEQPAVTPSSMFTSQDLPSDPSCTLQLGDWASNGQAAVADTRCRRGGSMLAPTGGGGCVLCHICDGNAACA